jgi:hypothetical protein
MQGRNPLLRTLLAGVAALASAALSSTADLTAQARSWEDALEFYELRHDAPSLGRRTRARYVLASSGDPRAFDMLVRDYGRPEEPQEFVHSTIAGMASQFFRHRIAPEKWAAWRDDFDKREHAYLWLHALWSEAALKSPTWRQVALEHKDAVIRSVAIQAGAVASHGPPTEDDLDVLEAVYEDLPRRGGEREVLLEALAWAFDGGSPERFGPRDRALLRRLADELEERSTSDRCKRTLSRLFAKALDRTDIGPVYEAWQAVLKDEVGSEEELLFGRHSAAFRQSFFGIPTNGTRVVYVLDASDSMLEPLTPRELADLAPKTGGDEGGGGGRGARGDAGSLRAEQAIDWSKVKSRFDAAKALLRIALDGLDKDTRFAVVLFGTEVRVLESTPALVKVNPRIIHRVMQEIDDIPIGPRAQNRPYGTLLGSTNMHGGLLAAFQLTERRMVERHPDVSLDALEYGSDTIYLLSDGAPSSDNWDAPDANLDGVVGDAETGQTRKWDGAVIVHGPFAQPHHLELDIQRLNMIRNCVIHTVGLGEAERGLMQRLAESHFGKALQIGG